MHFDGKEALFFADPGFDRGPDQYLDQTRDWVAAFKAGTLCGPGA